MAPKIRSILRGVCQYFKTCNEWRNDNEMPASMSKTQNCRKPLSFIMMRRKSQYAKLIFILKFLLVHMTMLLVSKYEKLHKLLYIISEQLDSRRFSEWQHNFLKMIMSKISLETHLYRNICCYNSHLFINKWLVCELMSMFFSISEYVFSLLSSYARISL